MIAANERGVTLVELMVTLFIGGVILLAASNIVVQADSWLRKGRQRLELQRDFSLIARVLAENIRESEYGKQAIFTSLSDYAAGDAPQASGSFLRVVFPGGDSLRFGLEGKDFIVITAADTGRLVRGTVAGLEFVDQGRYLQTRLVLQKNAWTLADTLYDAFRNF